MIRLCRIEKGQSLIEYVLILSLVLLAGVTTIGGVGVGVRDRAEGVADYIEGGELGGGTSNVGDDDEVDNDEIVNDDGVVLEPLEDYFEYTVEDPGFLNTSGIGYNLSFKSENYDFDAAVCDLNIPERVYIDKSNGKHYREVKDDNYGNEGVYYLKSNNGYEEVNVEVHDVKSLQGFIMGGIPSTVKEIKLSVDEDNSIVDISHLVYDVKGDVYLDLSDFKGVKPIWMVETFAQSSGFKELDLSTLDTSDTITMSGLFRGCTRLERVTYGDGFDTSNVKSMRRMFQSTRMEDVDLSKFDTRNVEDMKEMFSTMIRLKSINFGDNFDTRNVTDMYGMFRGSSVLENLDLSRFDTSKVTDMSEMFKGVERVKRLDLSRFNTGNVTNMKEMFSGCSDLEYLDISNFDTSKVTDMSKMFSWAGSLKEPVFGNFKIPSEDVDISSMTDRAHKAVKDAVNKAKQWK